MKAAAPRQLISHISEPSHCQLAGSFLTDSINILFCNLYGAIQPRFPPALCHPLLHLILNLILQRERERESFAVCSAKSKGFCNSQLGTAPTQRLKGILEAAPTPPPPPRHPRAPLLPQDTTAGLISPHPPAIFPRVSTLQWKGSAQPLFLCVYGAAEHRGCNGKPAAVRSPKCFHRTELLCASHSIPSHLFSAFPPL